MSDAPGPATAVYYLGIDAGGSNCRARLADASGAVLGEGGRGPANTGLER